MAHCDYDCCAICDSKMAYNGSSANTKESVCIDCIERSIAAGKPITRLSHVVEALAAMTHDAALKWLHAIGYRPCCYENEIDDYLIARKLVLTGSDSPGAKWGRLLAPLPQAGAPENKDTSSG